MHDAHRQLELLHLYSVTILRRPHLTDGRYRLVTVSVPVPGDMGGLVEVVEMVEAVEVFEVVRAAVGVSGVGIRGMLVLEARGGQSGTDYVEGVGTRLPDLVVDSSMTDGAGLGEDERRVGVYSRLIE